MRIIALLVVLSITTSAAAAPSDSYCVKVGHMTQTTAGARAAGATEEMLAIEVEKMFAVDPKKTPEQLRRDASNKKIVQNMTAYVYTVKLPVADARLVGYKKCLAGDFND